MFELLVLRVSNIEQIFVNDYQYKKIENERFEDCRRRVG